MRRGRASREGAGARHRDGVKSVKGWRVSKGKVALRKESGAAPVKSRKTTVSPTVESQKKKVPPIVEKGLPATVLVEQMVPSVGLMVLMLPSQWTRAAMRVAAMAGQWVPQREQRPQPFGPHARMPHA